jgi:hypothetical protein
VLCHWLTGWSSAVAGGHWLTAWSATDAGRHTNADCKKARLISGR